MIPLTPVLIIIRKLHCLAACKRTNPVPSTIQHSELTLNDNKNAQAIDTGGGHWMPRGAAGWLVLPANKFPVY